jgi:lambda repressor-like predicted transcriptional regulator
MKISDLLKDPNKTKEILKEAIYNGDKELAEMLIPIVRDPNLTELYAEKIVKGKIKDEWEDIIAQDGKWSYWYAYKVLKGPFPKGEDAISKNPWSSYVYAFNVIKGPWPKGEDAIATQPNYSFEYAAYILHGPFPKGENAIATNSNYSFRYAKEVLNDRFIKGENTIINDPDSTYLKLYVKFLEQIKKLKEFLKDHPEIRIKI